MHSIVTTFREAVIKVEVANFGAAIDTLIDQDEGKRNGTIRFLDLKNIYLNAKIVILSASDLVQKLWSKMSFCIMVANVTRSRASHVRIAQDVF